MALKSVNSFTPHTAFEWTGHFFQGRVSHQACMPEGDFSASWWSRLTWNKSLCCLIDWKKSSELFTLIWLVIITWAICGLSLCSHVWLFVTPWTVACQAPLSMGILRARILEWVARPSSRGSSQPRDWTQGSNPVLPHCSLILYHLSHLGSTCKKVTILTRPV